MSDEYQLTPYEARLGARLTNEQAIEEISRRLILNLDSLYPDIDKSEVRIHGYSLAGLFAHTFRFDISSVNHSVSIFAKICPMYESLNPARMEYDTLKLVYEKMHALSNKYAVSRPLLYLEDMNCYAMESVGFRDLRTVLLKNNSIFAQAENVGELRGFIRGSAEWLALFHDITSNNISRRFDVKEFIDGFTDEFNYREIDNFAFKSPVLALIDSTFNKLSESTHALAMPLAGWHWDYTPGHVYLDNNKISVIDILGLDKTPVFEDIGHFLASITSINNLPKYPLFNRKRSATDFCDAFISAYLNKTTIPEHEFLVLSNIYRLKHLIIYFLIQNRQITQKLGSVAGNLYSNYRGIALFEKPLLHCLSEISRHLEMLPD